MMSKGSFWIALVSAIFQITTRL